MAYILNTSAKKTFTQKVTVLTPNNSNGHTKDTFTAKFSQPSKDDLKALRGQEPEEVFGEVLVGWGEDLQDEANEPVPFTPENKAAMLTIPPVLAALAEAFWQNVVKANTKN